MFGNKWTDMGNVWMKEETHTGKRWLPEAKNKIHQRRTPFSLTGNVDLRVEQQEEQIFTQLDVAGDFAQRAPPLLLTSIGRNSEGDTSELITNNSSVAQSDLVSSTDDFYSLHHNNFDHLRPRRHQVSLDDLCRPYADPEIPLENDAQPTAELEMPVLEPTEMDSSICMESKTADVSENVISCISEEIVEHGSENSDAELVASFPLLETVPQSSIVRCWGFVEMVFPDWGVVSFTLSDKLEKCKFGRSAIRINGKELLQGTDVNAVVKPGMKVNLNIVIEDIGFVSYKAVFVEVSTADNNFFLPELLNENFTQDNKTSREIDRFTTVGFINDISEAVISALFETSCGVETVSFSKHILMNNDAVKLSGNCLDFLMQKGMPIELELIKEVNGESDYKLLNAKHLSGTVHLDCSSSSCLFQELLETSNTKHTTGFKVCACNAVCGYTYEAIGTLECLDSSGLNVLFDLGDGVSKVCCPKNKVLIEGERISGTELLENLVGVRTKFYFSDPITEANEALTLTPLVACIRCNGGQSVLQETEFSSIVGFVKRVDSTEGTASFLFDGTIKTAVFYKNIVHINNEQPYSSENLTDFLSAGQQVVLFLPKSELIKEQDTYFPSRLHVCDRIDVRPAEYKKLAETSQSFITYSNSLKDPINLLDDGMSPFSKEKKFIGVVVSVSGLSALASFELKGSEVTACFQNHKIHHRGVRIGKKLNAGELLVPGMKVFLHFSDTVKFDQWGYYIPSVVETYLDDEERSDIISITDFDVYFSLEKLACSECTVYGRIISVYDSWGTVLLKCSQTEKKAIFVRGDVYINKQKIGADTVLSSILSTGMPVSLTSDIRLVMTWFVGKVIHLTKYTGIISFRNDEDFEKAVIICNEVYTERKKSISDNLSHVLKLGEEIVFGVIPFGFKTKNIKFQAVYFFNSDQAMNLKLLCGTAHKPITANSDLCCTTEGLETEKVRTYEERTQNIACETWVAPFVNTSPLASSKTEPRNSAWKMLDAVDTVLVSGGLLWKEYLSKQFPSNSADIRLRDVTAVVSAEGTLLSGEMKILFKPGDVYVDGSRSSCPEVGSSFHCTVTKLPESGPAGETHYAWCVWQGSRPDVHHVFASYPRTVPEELHLKDGSEYVGLVVAVYPPNAAYVELDVGGTPVPVVVFYNVIIGKRYSTNIPGGPWVNDFINVGDYLDVTVMEAKKNSKSHKVGCRWKAVKAVMKANGEKSSSLHHKHTACAKYSGKIVSICKSFGIIKYTVGESSRFGLFIRDYLTIDCEKADDRLHDLFSSEAAVFFCDCCLHYFTKNVFYVTCVYTQDLKDEERTAGNESNLSKAENEDKITCNVKHLPCCTGVLTRLIEDVGILQAGKNIAIFHKSDLFLSGKRFDLNNFDESTIQIGMTLYFTAVTAVNQTDDLTITHCCTCVWDTVRPGIETVFESFLPQASDGKLLNSDTSYIGEVVELAPPRIALVCIKTLGDSVPVLLHVKNLIASDKGKKCQKDDWIQDRVIIGDILELKISGSKYMTFRTVSEATKLDRTLSPQELRTCNKSESYSNVYGSSARKIGIFLKSKVDQQLDHNFDNKSESDVLDQEKQSACVEGFLDLNRTNIDNISSSRCSPDQTWSAGCELLNNSFVEDIDFEEDTMQEISYPDELRSTAEEGGNQSSNCSISNANSAGCMLVVGAAIWKEYEARRERDGADPADGRFTDARVTELEPVSDTVAVVTVEGPCGPVRARLHEKDTYADANGTGLVRCTVIRLPEPGPQSETHIVWLLWKGGQPEPHRIFKVFQPDCLDAFTLQDGMRYEGTVIALFPPSLALARVAVGGSSYLPVILHMDGITPGVVRHCLYPTGPWILDFISIGDRVTMYVGCTEGKALKKLGFRWLATEWKRADGQSIDYTSTAVDEIFSGTIWAMFDVFGLVSFRLGHSYKKAMFFKEHSTLDWEELKNVSSYSEVGVSFRLEPECCNPKGLLCMAKAVEKLKVCNKCGSECFCVLTDSQLDSVVKNTVFDARVEIVTQKAGAATFRLLGKIECAFFFYNKLFYKGAKIKSPLLRKGDRVAIRVSRANDPSKFGARFRADYVEIKEKELENDLTNSEGRHILQDLSSNLKSSDIPTKVVNSNASVKKKITLMSVVGKIKAYKSPSCGVIEFSYNKKVYELLFNKSVAKFPPESKVLSSTMAEVWPVGKMIYFDATFCDSDMNKGNVLCVWEGKKVKRTVYKNAGELLSEEKQVIKPGGKYQAKVTKIRMFSFIASIEVCGVTYEVRVSNTAFRPSFVSEKLSREDCVSVHLSVGDIIYVIVEKVAAIEKVEWRAIEAWKECSGMSGEHAIMKKKQKRKKTGIAGRILSLTTDTGQLVADGGQVVCFSRENALFYGLPLTDVALTDVFAAGDDVNFTVAEGSCLPDGSQRASEVWMGSREVYHFAESYKGIARFCSVKQLGASIFNCLMQKLSKHRQTEASDIRSDEDDSQMPDYFSDTWEDSSSLVKNSPSLDSKPQMKSTEDTKSGYDMDYCSMEHNNESNMNKEKAVEHALELARFTEIAEDLSDIGACTNFFSCDARSAMEKALYKIVKNMSVSNYTDVVSQALQNVEEEVRKSVSKDILPKALAKALVGLTPEAQDVIEWWDQSVEMRRASACRKKSTIDCGTQTVSTGKVVYLNIIADD